MDVRPGGSGAFIMHGPDGTDYPTASSTRRSCGPERLVYLHGEDVDDDPGAFHVTVRFDDLDGRTRVTQRMLFATAAQREGVEQFGAVELGKQTMARLAAYLETMYPPAPEAARATGGHPCRESRRRLRLQGEPGCASPAPNPIRTRRHDHDQPSPAP